ncbi:MAG: hypothetical protein IMZ50_11175 [Candidatus Atribacteria bacterium]|nr:hypothetical protein [Candidatus Atribacteria bacterium]
MQKRLRLPLLVLVLACPASTHLQPFLLKSLGALDGSFGLRPMSHACADLRLNGASIGLAARRGLPLQARGFLCPLLGG